MAYGLATILMLMAYPNLSKYKLISLLFIYSFCIEIAQQFAENRLFEVADLAANFIGILLAILLLGYKVKTPYQPIAIIYTHSYSYHTYRNHTYRNPYAAVMR